MQGNLKRHLGWVEAGFFLGGVAMLAAFFMLRFQGEQQREAGIKAFHQSVQGRAADRGEWLAGPVSGTSFDATAAAPDLELWADKRIRAYKESLLVEADPPLAVMTIEKLNIRVPVYDGADDFNLNRGVGRIKGTARIGSDGNLGIAGHRDGFFRGLKDIAPGDGIQLQTMNGTEVYTVSSIDIVEPTDVSVLTPSEEKTLTLVTCYPFYYVGHAPQRYIVKATARHSLAKN